MPGDNFEEYLSCKKKSTSLKQNYQKNYSWGYIRKLENVQEIAPLLIQLFNEYAIYSHYWSYVEKMVADILKEYPKSNKIFKSGSLSFKISKSYFESYEFDAETISYLTFVVSALINHGEQVAIDFSEVYFVPDNEAPPAHYRNGIDRCVNNLDDYRELTSQFSYQFFKSIINYTRPLIDSKAKKQTSADLLVDKLANTKQNDSMKNNFVDLKLALNQQNYFGSAFEAMINYELNKSDSLIKTAQKKKKHRFSPHRFILAFNAQVTSTELPTIINHFSRSVYTGTSRYEQIIVMQGKAYERPEERAKVYNEILKLTCNPALQVFLHVFLIPEEPVNLNFLELAPSLQLTDDPFSPLAENAGYYLSSPDIFSNITRNIYKCESTYLTSEWFKNLTEKSLEQAVKKPKEIKLNQGYIYQDVAGEHFRASKLYTKEDAKLKISLNFLHEQELQQIQEQNQELNLNQDIALQQNVVQQKQKLYKQDFNSNFWTPPCPLVIFYNELIRYSGHKLKLWTEEELLLEDLYYTSHYRAHFSERRMFTKLANDKQYGVSLLAKILGLAYSKKDTIASENSIDFLLDELTAPYANIKLPDNYSLEGVESYLIPDISRHLTDFQDGLHPNSRHLTYSYILGNPILAGWDNIPCARSPATYAISNLPINFSSLALLANKQDVGYQSHFNVSLLITPEELSEYDNTQDLISCARTLLETLYPENQFKEEYESNLIHFIDVYIPGYSDILIKFMTVFSDHNNENIRIFLQLIISGRREYFKVFLDFLVYLDERCLLTNFYKIYFQYAPNNFSLVNFFKPVVKKRLITSHSHNGDKVINNELTIKEHPEACFLELVGKTPLVNSSDEWPLFEKFSHALMVFAAKNQIPLISQDLKEIESFWHRIAAKFFVYTDSNRAQTELFVNSLVGNLVTEDGLNLAALRKLDSLLNGLENLLDHAIAKQTLSEQLSELAGLSFVLTDVPYAIAKNSFLLISKEMEIEAGSMGCKRDHYSVNRSELSTVIKNHRLSSTFLIPALFRYLGQESFREKLSFYRELAIFKSEQAEIILLEQLVFAYYVFKTTGLSYNPRPEKEYFIKDCRTFLLTHSQAEQFKDSINDVLNDFYERLSQLKSSEQHGSVCLWSLWKDKNLDILKDKRSISDSAITTLAQKFERRHLNRYLLQFQTEIAACLPYLNDDPILAFTLLANCFEKADVPKYQTTLALLLIINPEFNLSYFLEHLLEILIFIDCIKAINDPQQALYFGLRAVLSKHPYLGIGIALTKLCAPKLQDNPEKINLCNSFLLDLANNSDFLLQIDNLEPSFDLILDYYLSTKVQNSDLRFLVGFCELLKEEEADLGEDDRQHLLILLKFLQTEPGYQFFYNQEGLTALKLRNMARLIKLINNPSLTLPLIHHALSANAKLPIDELTTSLSRLPRENLTSIIYLCNWICSAEEKPQLNIYLEKLKSITPNILAALTHLCKRYAISSSDLLTILAASSIQNAIEQFECAQEKDNTEWYDYDPKDIAKKIAQIHLKSWDGGPNKPLSAFEQDQLLKEYKQLMALMQDCPILIEKIDRRSKAYTAHELTSRQFSLLFSELQQKISRGEDKKQNQLILLALCAKALHKTCGKFPRSTQLLCLLHSINQEGHIIQEIKTGEGKSIINAFHAVLQIAEGKTANIVTENEQLARDGINAFKDFFNYLGIRCGNHIIEAQSTPEHYLANGVNYSTPYGLILFFMCMELNQIKLPKNRTLIWDEIDANLTSIIEFRLAAVLNRVFQDTKRWAIIYQNLLDFVQEKDLFLNNKCDDMIDVHNFRLFCLLRNPDKQLSALINKVDPLIFNGLIDSARIAGFLDADLDYMVVTKYKGTKKSFYAAPILEHNKRPDEKASFAAGVQPLIHMKENRTLPPGSFLSFEIEPSSETIITLSIKNFFDYFRLLGGRCIGSTGSGGSEYLRDEFHRYHGLTVFNYPSYHEDLCEDHGIFPSESCEGQWKTTFELINEKKAFSAQPILIITESPQAAFDLKKYLLQRNNSLDNQSFCGHDLPDFSEEMFIHEGGKDNKISIATRCESRGADFYTNYPDGFLVINLCTDLTEEELIQIKGRASRNGKPGEFCSVINVTKLGLIEDSSLYQIAEAFKAHQQQITLKAQEERLKNLLLGDARYHTIKEYLIKLRTKADKILNEQHGKGKSLVPRIEFDQTLSNFTTKAADYYSALLGEGLELSNEASEDFLTYLITAYNTILDKWLPDDKFINYQVVEPAIPLDKLTQIRGLNRVKLEQLTLLSELLSSIWQDIGHQNITTVLSQAEHYMSLLTAAAKEKKGLKTIIAELLLTLDFIKIPEVVENIAEIQSKLSDLMTEFPTIPVIDSFLPKQKLYDFVNNYLETTKSLCLEKKWEELTLPALNLETLKDWADKLPILGAKPGKASKLAVTLFVSAVVMPQLKELIHTHIIKEQFAEQPEKQFILHAALKKLSGPIKKLLIQLPFKMQSEKGIWSLILDHLLPILEHKSAHQAAEVFGKESQLLLRNTIKYIKVLAPYREFSIHELVNLKTLLPLFKQACQLDLVQQFIKNPTIKEMANRFSAFDSQSLETLYHLDFVSLFNLIQVVANPDFFHFLKSLPQQANFGQLKSWLKSEPENLHPSIRPALKNFKEHLLEKEHSADNKRIKLLGLKERFTLSIEKLKAGLNALNPFPVEEKDEEPVLAEEIHELLEIEEDDTAEQEDKVTAPLPNPIISAESDLQSSVKKSRFSWLKAFFIILAITLMILFSWIILPVLIIGALTYACIKLFSRLYASLTDKTIRLDPSMELEAPVPVEVEQPLPYDEYYSFLEKSEPISDFLFLDDPLYPEVLPPLPPVVVSLTSKEEAVAPLDFSVEYLEEEENEVEGFSLSSIVNHIDAANPFAKQFSLQGSIKGLTAELSGSLKSGEPDLRKPPVYSKASAFLPTLFKKATESITNVNNENSLVSPDEHLTIF